MFMGSEHAPYPQFDRLLEAAGANNNGSTTNDRTNYYEWGPSNALPAHALARGRSHGMAAADDGQRQGRSSSATS